MKIESRQDLNTGKIFADIILTEEEVKKLIDGKVVKGEVPNLAIQIVGYGEEKDKGVENEQDTATRQIGDRLS